MMRRRLMGASADSDRLIYEASDFTPTSQPDALIDLSRPWAAEFDVSTLSDRITLPATSFAFFALNNDGGNAWLYYIKPFETYVQISSDTHNVEIDNSLAFRRYKRLKMTLRHDAMSDDRDMRVAEAACGFYIKRDGSDTPYKAIVTQKSLTVTSDLLSPAHVVLTSRFYYNSVKLYYTD